MDYFIIFYYEQDYYIAIAQCICEVLWLWHVICNTQLVDIMWCV